MPDQVAIKRGYEFEDHVANILGLTKQPGSGNKFYAKNDCVGNGLSVSCKSEANLTWPKIIRYLYESIESSYQTGAIPVLALDGIDDDEDLVIIRLSDLAKAFSNGIKIDNSVQSKGIAKREEADIPLMLR